jgi:hypothetical protein
MSTDPYKFQDDLDRSNAASPSPTYNTLMERRPLAGSSPGLFIKVQRNAPASLSKAASMAGFLFSSPGLQAGVRSDFLLRGRFSGLPLFGFSPCRSDGGSPLKRAQGNRVLSRTQA